MRRVSTNADFGTGGTTFRPTLPAGWGDATLNGANQRWATP
ncbi:hypothetical protein [Streptomyces sp. NBC_00448]